MAGSTPPLGLIQPTVSTELVAYQAEANEGQPLDDIASSGTFRMLPSLS